MKSTEFKFQTPTNVRIGDELYFDQVSNDPKMLDLIFDKCIPPYFISGIKIAEMEHEEDLAPWTKVIIAFAPNKKIKILNDSKDETYDDLLNIYLAGFQLEDCNDNNKDLGCDTASFDIYVDNRYYHINTMADGFYGNVSTYRTKDNKSTLGIVVTIWLDSAAYDYEEVINIFKYIFNIKEDN